jgi:hypothetical protein
MDKVFSQMQIEVAVVGGRLFRLCRRCGRKGRGRIYGPGLPASRRSARAHGDGVLMVDWWVGVLYGLVRKTLRRLSSYRLAPLRSRKSGPPCLANRASSREVVAREKTRLLGLVGGEGGEGSQRRVRVRLSSSFKAPWLKLILDSLSQNSGGYSQDAQASSSTSLLVLVFFAGGSMSAREGSSARCRFRVCGLAMSDPSLRVKMG